VLGFTSKFDIYTHTHTHTHTHIYIYIYLPLKDGAMTKITLWQWPTKTETKKIKKQDYMGPNHGPKLLKPSGWPR